MSEPSYVCERCKDTHRMMDFRYEHPVSCTSCPTPCDKCRQGRTGAYCETTPCDCDCHKEHSVPNTKMTKLTLEGVRNGLNVVSNQIDSLSKKLDEDQRDIKQLQKQMTCHSNSALRVSINGLDSRLKVLEAAHEADEDPDPANPQQDCQHDFYCYEYGMTQCRCCGLRLNANDIASAMRAFAERL